MDKNDLKVRIGLIKAEIQYNRDVLESSIKKMDYDAIKVYADSLYVKNIKLELLLELMED